MARIQAELKHCRVCGVMFKGYDSGCCYDHTKLIRDWREEAKLNESVDYAWDVNRRAPEY